jgi:ParB family chromosome partitioning protein
MAKSRNTGLGRDFNSIFEDNFIDNKKNPAENLRICDIEPNPEQPRRNFDEGELAALAESIAEFGVLQPIVVTENVSPVGTYRIVAGERRWRASMMAGLDEIPCVIFDGDDLAAAQVALVENIVRQDLSAVEEAMGYRALIERFGMTQEAVAAKVGKSRPAITNSLRLLDLPDEVLALVSDGSLGGTHARALLGLEDSSLIPVLASRVIEEGMSVRAVEAAVREYNKPKKPKKAAVVADEQTQVYMEQLQSRAASLLCRRIKITDKGEGKRRIEIDYTDADDLSELLLTLCGPDIFSL